MTTKIIIALTFCLALASAATVYERFSGPLYQSQTAEQKMNQIWTELTANQTSLGWYDMATLLTIFAEPMKTTFETYSDVFPPGRKLLTHTVGTVAQVEIIAEKGTPYTGIFQGSSNALLRFATALQTNPTVSEPWGNFNPALALKIFRDNVPSANILAMYTADGQKTWNPFGCDWSNHIPAPATPLVQKLDAHFKSATPLTGRLGVKDAGQFNVNGEELTDGKIKIPFRLIFRPTSEVNKMFPDTFSDFLYNQMKTIPAGTNIYDVLAIEQPYGPAVKIATIRSKTKFVTSNFGDQNLFFKHSYIEKDLQLNPSWREAMAVDPPIAPRVTEIVA